MGVTCPAAFGAADSRRLQRLLEASRGERKVRGGEGEYHDTNLFPLSISRPDSDLYTQRPGVVVEGREGRGGDNMIT